jgi:hypothetical protein
MAILRFAVLIFLVVVGAAAVLMGGVILSSALSSGKVMMTYVANGQPVAETFLRSADPSRFWRLVSVMGVLPLLLGGASAWFGWRKLRG